MAWPTTSVVTGDTITAAQLNLLTAKVGDVVVVDDQVTQIDLTVLPNYYRHLRLIVTAQATAGNPVLNMTVNGVVTASYSRQYLAVNTSVLAGSELLAATSASLGYVPGSDTRYWSHQDVLFPDYQRAGVNRMWIASAHHIENAIGGNGHVGMWSGFVDDTNPLTSVSLSVASATFAKGSRIEIVGMP